MSRKLSLVLKLHIYIFVGKLQFRDLFTVLKLLGITLVLRNLVWNCDSKFKNIITLRLLLKLWATLIQNLYQVQQKISVYSISNWFAHWKLKFYFIWPSDIMFIYLYAYLLLNWYAWIFFVWHLKKYISYSNLMHL